MPKAACAGFLHAHSEAWQSATVHPFLQQCQQGTLVPAQFNTWLVQDYLFVIEFTRFAGRLLAAAPVAHFDTLLGGLTVIKDELQWFESKAQERGLAMPAAMQPTCQALLPLYAGSHA